MTTQKKPRSLSHGRLSQSTCVSGIAALKVAEEENVGFDAELSGRMRTSYPLAAVVSTSQSIAATPPSDAEACQRVDC